jgi:peptidoglycan/LPS O-acetylase OafA/YrhL
VTIVQAAAIGSHGKSPYRPDALLSLRGLAALAVVCHHAGLGPYLAALTGSTLLGAFAVSGSYAVIVFFCISGYLMAKILDRSYGPDDITKFYWNRAARVLPTYYLAFVITAGLYWQLMSSQAWPVLALANNYFFTIQFPNAALWSLATECQFYLIAPLIAGMARRWTSVPICLMLAGLAAKALYFVLSDQVTPQHRHIMYMGLEANLLPFMSGWAAYTYRSRLPVLSPRLGLIIITAAMMAIWLFHFLYIDNTPSGLYRSAMWMLIFPVVLSAICILILPALDRGELGAKSFGLGDQFLFFLGVTSYSVYVLHLRLIGIIMQLSVPLKILLVYAAATIVFVAFEKPLFRLRTG